MSKLEWRKVEGEPDAVMAFGERSRSYVITTRHFGTCRRKRRYRGFALRLPIGTEMHARTLGEAKAYAQGTEATHCERDVRAAHELPAACPRCGESLHCRGCANEEVRR
jgi:hypothetical protein